MSFINVDPKLSEFSQQQLVDVAVAIDLFLDEEKKHLLSLSKHEVLRNMFADKIQEMEARIERLQTVYNQLVNAHTRKEYLRRVASN